MFQTNNIDMKYSYLLLVLSATLTFSAYAHDPVFGLGPHVLFKGGLEIAPEIHSSKSGNNKKTEMALELTYGITGDWAAGIKLPYNYKLSDSSNTRGQGDISLFTKYRFWRDDGPGVQESMSLAVKIKTDSAESNLGTGTTDNIIGLSYGYEARKWYRWAALRYRFNNENDEGFGRGNKLLFDLVGGIRLKKTGYREPDLVWLIELNGESTEKDKLNGDELSRTGGQQWFIAPGIFWTQRNFAVKSGIQLAIADTLNPNQQKDDYRAKIILEWHL